MSLDNQDHSDKAERRYRWVIAQLVHLLKNMLFLREEQGTKVTFTKY
jgi:hypothetical protein